MFHHVKFFSHCQELSIEHKSSENISHYIKKLNSVLRAKGSAHSHFSSEINLEVTIILSARILTGENPELTCVIRVRIVDMQFFN